MGNFYSVDLRERVLSFVDEGGAKVEACKLFKIGHNTLYLWIRQRKERGTIEPKIRGKYKTRKIEESQLREYVKAHADATLSEMAEIFSVSSVAIWKALRRFGITYKKKSSVQRAGRRKA